MDKQTTSSEVAFQQQRGKRRQKNNLIRGCLSITKRGNAKGETTSSEVAFQLFNKLFGITIFQWFKNIPFIIIYPEQF